MAEEKVKDNLSLPAVEDTGDTDEISAEDWAGFDDDMKEAFREAGYRPEGEESKAENETEEAPGAAEPEVEKTETEEPEKEKEQKESAKKAKKAETPKEEPEKEKKEPEKEKNPDKQEEPVKNAPKSEEESQKQEQKSPLDEKKSPAANFKSIPVPPLNFPVIEAPEDIDSQISAVTDNLKKLADDFDSGNVTSSEYNSKMLELQDKRQDLRLLKQRAEDSRIQNEKWQKEVAQRRNTEWVNNCGHFLSQHTEYDPKNDPMLYNLLNSTVADLRNGKYKEDSTNPEILAEAHAQVQDFLHRRFGDNAVAAGTMSAGEEAEQAGKSKAAAPKAASPKRSAEPKKAPEPEGKKQTERPMAPNIGNMPAAGTADDGANPFAYLDRLAREDTVRYEKELAKLSPSQLEEYSIRGGSE